MPETDWISRVRQWAAGSTAAVKLGAAVVAALILFAFCFTLWRGGKILAPARGSGGWPAGGGLSRGTGRCGGGGGVGGACRVAERGAGGRGAGRAGGAAGRAAAPPLHSEGGTSVKATRMDPFVQTLDVRHSQPSGTVARCSPIACCPHCTTTVAAPSQLMPLAVVIFAKVDSMSPSR